MEKKHGRRTGRGRALRRSIAALALLAGNLTVLVGPGSPPAQASQTVVTFVENFDNVAAPALPPGWTSTVVTGRSTDKPWKTGSPAVSTYPMAASADAVGHATDINLTSPAFVALADSGLTFEHQTYLQPRSDGGVLEIKIGTGPFVDFLAAGGRFTQDGYNNTMTSGALANRAAWTGYSNSGTGGPLTQYTQGYLPASAAGKSVQLRWRLVTDGALGDGGFFKIDSVHVYAPTVDVTINVAAGQAKATSGSTINYTATFSKPVTGFTGTDVYVGGTAPGTKTVTVTGGPSTYNVAVSGMTGAGFVEATIPYGVVNEVNEPSTSTDNTVTYYPPSTVTIDKATDQADPTNALPITFKADFSTFVSGFSATDVRIGGTAPGISTSTVTVTGGPRTYTVRVTGLTGAGTVVASIPANVVDQGNLASTSTDNSVAYAKVTATINQAAAQTDPATKTPIAFTAVFSGPVTGFTGSDVTIGGTAPGTKTATVTGGPTTYSVTVSGLTGPGTVVASIPANVVADGNAASTSTDNSITFDNVAPKVTINQAATQTDPATTTPVAFTAVFSEPVTGFTGTDVTIGGTAVGTKTATVTGGPTTYKVAVSGMTGAGTVVASIPAGRASDLAGNASAASTSTDNSVSGTFRPVTINQAAGQADPTKAPSVSFTVTFGTAVTGFTGTDVVLGGTAPGTKAATVTGGPSTYTVTVSGMTGSGTVVASIPADAVNEGNLPSTSKDNSVTYDTVAPRVTINQASTQADPTSNVVINFTATFNEPVTGFTGSDVAIAGAAPGTKTATVTGGPATYNVAVSGMTASGTVIVSIPAGRATDLAGNLSVASTSTDSTVSYVYAPPRTVTIKQGASQADPTNGSVVFDVVFSAAVTGLTSADVTVGGTATGTKTVSVTGGPSTYAVTVTGMTGPGTVVASIPANVVLEGNTASTTTDNSVTFDNVKPIVSINQAASQVDPTSAAPILFTVVLSEPVRECLACELIAFGGAPGQLVVTVSGGPTTFTAAVTGMTGSGFVELGVYDVLSDAAGNYNSGYLGTPTGLQVDFIYPTSGPTVTINQASTQVDPAATGPITFTVTFTSAVSGFTESDVVISGTAPGAKTVVVTGDGTGSGYAVTVSGMTGPGTVVASIPAGAAADGGGAPNLASSSTDNTVTYAP